MPILSLANSSLITLSSPEKSNNYFSRLSVLKEEDSNDTFFRIVNCFMICAECRKLEKSEQIKCDHVKQGAFWLDQRKVRRLKRLYASDPATAIREFGGIVEDDYDACFNKSEIDRVFSLPHVSCEAVPRYIIVAVDPNGGGASKMAITSGYFDSNGVFIVSAYFPIMYASFVALTKFSVVSTMFVGLYGKLSVWSTNVFTRITSLRNICDPLCSKNPPLGS